MRANKNDCTIRILGNTIGLNNTMTTKAVSKTQAYTLDKKLLKRHNKTRKDIDNLIVKAIKDCKAKKKVLVLPYTLGGGGSHHANILIFNYHLKTLERYEPHGSYTGASYTNIDQLDNNIKDWLEKLKPQLKKEGLGDDWKYLDLLDFKSCPRPSILKNFIGLQGLFRSDKMEKKVEVGGVKMTFKDPNGWCVAWSAFLLNERLKYLKQYPAEIHKKIMKVMKGFSREKANKILRNFAIAQYTELKKILKKIGTKGIHKPLTKEFYHALILKYTMGTAENNRKIKKTVSFEEYFDIKDKLLKEDIKSYLMVKTNYTAEKILKNIEIIYDQLNDIANEKIKKLDLKGFRHADRWKNDPKKTIANVSSLLPRKYVSHKWDIIFQYYIRKEYEDAIIN